LDFLDPRNLPGNEHGELDDSFHFVGPRLRLFSSGHTRRRVWHSPVSPCLPSCQRTAGFSPDQVAWGRIPPRSVSSVRGFNRLTNPPGHSSGVREYYPHEPELPPRMTRFSGKILVGGRKPCSGNDLRRTEKCRNSSRKRFPYPFSGGTTRFTRLRTDPF
jgi:hypothetical protein